MFFEPLYLPTPAAFSKDAKQFRELPPYFKVIIADTFKQMMYVSGETGEPSVETTSIIEDIVRQQVIELV